MNWITFFADNGPKASAVLVYGLGASALLLGVLLILWGKPLSRVVLLLAGAGVGIAMGPTVAGWTQLEVLYCRIGCGVLVAALGAGLAPVVWAVLAGGLFAAGAAAGVLLAFYPNVPDSAAKALQNHAYEPILEWLGWLGQFLWQCVQLAATGHEAVFFPAVGLAMVAPIVVFVLRMRLGTIFMTSLLGAAAAVAGVLTIVMQAEIVSVDGFTRLYYIPCATAGALLAAGMAIQYRRTARAKRDKAEGDADAGEEKSRAKAKSKSDK